MICFKRRSEKSEKNKESEEREETPVVEIHAVRVTDQTRHHDWRAGIFQDL